MDRVRIKETAKNLLKKNHWLCVGVAFVMALLGGFSGGSGPSFSFSYTSSGDQSSITSSLPFQSETMNEESILIFVLIFIAAFVLISALGFAIYCFLCAQVKVGGCRFFLKYRKNHPVEVGEIFKSYTDKTFLNVAKVSFMKEIEIFLWSLLCVIPGIIKTYEYFAVDYILAVNPTMDHKQARELSRKIMNGHKMELFELYISFMGWHILSVFTCGLLSIFYVTPYMLIAEAEFFAYVRENAIFNGVISYNDIPDYDEYIPQNPFGNYAPNGNPYQPPVNNGYAPYTPYTPYTPYAQPVSPVETPAAEPVAEPVVEKAVTEPVVKEALTEPVAEEAVTEPVVEKAVAEEPVIETVAEQPITEEPVTESSDEENNK